MIQGQPPLQYVFYSVWSCFHPNKLLLNQKKTYISDSKSSKKTFRSDALTSQLVSIKYRGIIIDLRILQTSTGYVKLLKVNPAPGIPNIALLLMSWIKICHQIVAAHSGLCCCNTISVLI